MTITVDSYGVTDVGQLRANNEDQFFIAELNASMSVHQTSVAIDECSTIFGQAQGHLFLVADGVGGHVAGERASALAISAVSAYALNGVQWLSHGEQEEAEVSDHLRRIAIECQRRLVRSAREHPSERGMATTLTLAVVMWPQLYVMHIGDSRCYLLRDGKLEQLTRDHTLGQLYTEASRDPSAAADGSHVLWNVVSSEDTEPPEADVIQTRLDSQDQLLLCTDGLYGYFDNRELAEIVAQSPSTREACERFVREAIDRGGKDNITVVVSRFRAGEQNSAKAMVETRVPLDEVIDTSDKVQNPADTDEFDVDSLKLPVGKQS